MVGGWRPFQVNELSAPFFRSNIAEGWDRLPLSLQIGAVTRSHIARSDDLPGRRQPEIPISKNRS
jgi:hypothetical protein